MIPLEQELLTKHWGYTSFRPLQREIIDSVKQGKDTLAIMPTGGGKSICFQIPALMKQGVCIVISPLIALMQDQVRNLKNRGIKAVSLSGALNYADLMRILENCVFGAYKLVYMSPEKLENKMVLEKMEQMKVNLIAIDEAHCLSHWGKDFRPSYLNCAILKKMFPQIPIIALTASATGKTREDILNILGIKESANVITQSLKRSNLAYMVYIMEDKYEILCRILKKNTQSSIIYVTNRGQTEELSNRLNKSGFESTYYHAGLLSEEKKENMNLWLYDRKQVIVATNAFGMGIDKADVKTVIHWNVPQSMEDYYQEAGRAGRNGKKAFSIVLLNKSDIRNMLEVSSANTIEIEDVNNIYIGLCNYLQIALGEGNNGEVFDVDIADFAKKFKFDVGKIIKVFEFLDTNGVISVDRRYSDRVYVTMTDRVRNMYKYIDQVPQYRIPFLYLIRTHTGDNLQRIGIKIPAMAQTLSISTKEVISFLEDLKSRKMIDYELKKTDLEVRFLKPRDNKRTINPISKNLKEYNLHKEKQRESVLEYINFKGCKQRYILDYFSEKTDRDCGVCSSCIEKAYGDKNLETIKEKVIEDLRKKPISVSNIEQKYSVLRQQAVEIIEELIEKKMVVEEGINNYKLVKNE